MIDQALYTHSEQLSGWGVLWCTRGHDPDLDHLIRTRSAYRFPVASRVAGEVPDRADDEVTLPSSLRLVVDGPVATLTSVQPTGRELSGTGVRGGNVVAHLLLADTPEGLRADRATRPIQLVGSATILDREPEPFEPRPLETVAPGSIVDMATALGRVASKEASDRSRALVAAVLRAHWAADEQCASVCVVGVDPAEVVGWLAVVAYSLPVGLSWQIAFDTFAARPDQVLTTGPTGETARRGVTVCGAVAGLLERGGVDPSTMLFDFTADEQPPCAPAGPFAARLLAASLAETTPLLAVVDDLADSTEVPTGEDGWLALLSAASLLLGAPVDADGHRLVALWLAEHAAALGPARVEVLAMALDDLALDADHLLAVVAAGSTVASTTVADRFEEVAFDRGLAQVMDRLAPMPTGLPVAWSPAIADRAAAALSAELDVATADVIVRLMLFAAATSIDLDVDVTETVGRDVVGIVVDRAMTFGHLPLEVRAGLCRGVVAQIDDEPLPDTMIPRLQEGLRATGLAEAMSREHLAAHPVAAAQIGLPADADDEARLRLLAALVTPSSTLSQLTIEALVGVLWPRGTMTVPVLEAVVGAYPSPERSHRLPGEVDRLVREADSFEILDRLVRLVTAMHLDLMLISADAESLIRVVDAVRRIEGGQETKAIGFDGIVRTIARQPPTDLAVDMARALGRHVIGLTAVQARTACRHWARSTGSGSPGAQDRGAQILSGLAAGVREAIDAIDPAREEDRLRVIGRVAIALRDSDRADDLTDLCKHTVPRWDANRIAAVTRQVDQEQGREQAHLWDEWASAHLRRRLLGRG